MYCYNCGSKLGSGRVCVKCGADISTYRRIVHLSNSYYNAALEKAKLRDLTGAADACRRSLQLYKKNTDARNLLGLIYFELGEVVDALCQWVVSKNLQPNDNLADEYLDIMQEDRNHLDSMNQAIKKYNLALDYARHNNLDLAIVQLKRVLKQQPHLMKAYQLLALIYISDEDYTRANRLLKQALKLDAGNTLCLKYSRMIRGKLSRGGSMEREAEERTRAALIAAEKVEDDVIVPDYIPRKAKSHTIAAALAGMAAALCLYHFVILPTVNRNEHLQENREIAAYDSKLADKELEVANLQGQLDDNSVEVKNMQESLAALTGSDGLSTQYDNLINALDLYYSKDSEDDEAALVEAFQQIDETAVDTENYREKYGMLKKYITVDRIDAIFKEGKQLFDDDYYQKAIPIFENCLKLNPDYVDAAYYLAKCYEHRKDNTNALKYYQMIVDKFQDSSHYSEAKDKVDALALRVEEEAAAAEGEANGADGEGADAANAEGADGADAENGDGADAENADDAGEDDDDEDVVPAW